MSLKCVCFWCAKDISDGSRCPHPEMSDAVASLLVRLEATTMCPETDNNLRRGNIVEADLRRAREEGEELSSVTDSIKEALRIMAEAKCWGAALGAVTEGYPWLAEGLKKVREEATVAAALTERDLLLTHQLHYMRNGKACSPYCGCGWQVPPTSSRPAGLHYEEHIRSLPLVTSKQAQEWLREHDAGVRLKEAQWWEHLAAEICEDAETSGDLCIYCDRLKELADQSQSTGTPAGTP